MSTTVPGARWQQLRSRNRSTPEGDRNYQAGYQQAQTYRNTMRLLNGMRSALGITQSELARRLEKSQPTVTRLLSHGENPTLETLDQVLRGLSIRRRLILETEDDEANGGGFVVEVKGMPRELYRLRSEALHEATPG